MMKKEMLNKKLFLLTLAATLKAVTPAYADTTVEAFPTTVDDTSSENSIEDTMSVIVVDEKAPVKLSADEEEQALNITEEANTIVSEPTEEIEEEQNDASNTYSDEGILTEVLKIYRTNFHDFNEIAKQCIEQSTLNGSPYQNIYEVARDFYRLSLISNEEKIAKVLPYFGITMEQLKAIQAVAVYESDDSRGITYCSGYLLANHFCARNNSIKWRGYAGSNIYQQLMKRGQYEVVSNGKYLNAIGKVCSVSDAVLDRLYVEAKEGEYQLYTRPYLSFRAAGAKGDEFLAHDNAYREPQADSDRIRPRFAKTMPTIQIASIKEEHILQFVR